MSLTHSRVRKGQMIQLLRGLGYDLVTLADLCEAAPIGLMMLDPRGTLLYANPAMIRLLGGNPDGPQPARSLNVFQLANVRGTRLEAALKGLLENGRPLDLGRVSVPRNGAASRAQGRMGLGPGLGTRGTVWLRGFAKMGFDGMPELVILMGMAGDSESPAAIRERRLVRALMRAREDERARIAGELHGDVGQTLATCRLALEQLLEVPELPASARRIGREVGRQVAHMVESFRSVESNLDPPLLEDVGLLDALDRLLKSVRKRTGLRTSLASTGGRIQPPSEVARQLYRIVQEALTNSLKHSSATRFSVRLDRHDGGLSFEVSDNGRGFDAARGPQSGGMGLRLMKERMATLGGTLAIQSGRKKGTRIQGWVPARGRGRET